MKKTTKKKSIKKKYQPPSALEQLEYLENSVPFIEKELKFFREKDGENGPHVIGLKKYLKKTKQKITMYQKAFEDIEKEN